MKQQPLPTTDIQLEIGHLMKEYDQLQRDVTHYKAFLVDRNPYLQTLKQRHIDSLN